MGREGALRYGSFCLKENYKGQNTSGSDRYKHPIPFVIGGPGVGKTRLLDEASTMMDMANIPHPRVNLFATYYDYYSIKRVERRMYVETSFT